MSKRKPPRVFLRSHLGRRVCEEQVQRGAWVRVRPGACIEKPVGERWFITEQLALARCVAASRQLKDVVLARTSAAAMHDLEVWRIPERPWVIQQRSPSSRSAADIQRSAALLDQEDIAEVHGCAVTTLLRTMLDCARHEHPRDALVVVDSGLRKLVNPRRDEAYATVDERAQPVRDELLSRIVPGSRGAAQARAVINASNPLAESAPESVLRWIAVSRGMPTPVLQKAVTTARGRFYTDMAWRLKGKTTARWLHIEFDGEVKYRKDPRQRDAARVLIAERKREAAITDTGDWVVRIYSDETDDEDRVFQKMSRKISPAVVASWRPDPSLFRLPGT